jgi:hypothetical protein
MPSVTDSTVASTTRRRVEPIACCSSTVTFCACRLVPRLHWKPGIGPGTAQLAAPLIQPK